MKRIAWLAMVLLCCTACTEDKEGPEEGGTTPITQKDTNTGPVECLNAVDCLNKVGPLDACQTARCVNGMCQTTTAPEGTACEDGGINLAVCQVARCDAAGTCRATAAPDGTACGETTFCSSRVCQLGVCSDTEPPNCNDNNDCTTDTCDPAFGCVHTDNTEPCDDGNACTAPDACEDGFCVGGPNSCECDTAVDCLGMDDNLCDGPLICVDNQCVNDDANPVECVIPDNLGQCEKVECNPATGICQQSVTEGVPCDDGEACTTGDFCAANGNCVKGTTVTCEYLCEDGADDDGDLLQDCDDPDCDDDPACQGGDDDTGGTTGDDTGAMDAGTPGDTVPVEE